MAYATEANALAQLTQVTFNGVAVKGILGVRFAFPVRRNAIRDASRLVAAVSRPVYPGGLDANAVVRMLDHDAAKAYNTAAANIVASFTEGGGSAATITAGTFVPGDIEDDGDHVDGGFPCQQAFEHEGTSITRTISQ